MSANGSVPKEANLTCDKPNILRALRDDNLDLFSSALADEADFNFRLKIEGEEKHWFLYDSLPVISVACFFGSIECFKYLCLSENPLNYEAPDLCNRRPIHFAAAGGNMDIIHGLVDKGIKLDSCDSREDYPSHYAAKFGHLDVLQYLWMHGAQLNPRNGTGATPLMWACGNGSEEIAKFLIDNGAKINELTRYKRFTPLHYACSKKVTNTLQLLVGQPGIDLDKMRTDLKTPLHTSIEAGSLECVKILIDAGASLTTGTYLKNKPMDFKNHPLADHATPKHFGIFSYLLESEKSLAVLKPSDVDLALKRTLASAAEFARLGHYEEEERSESDSESTQSSENECLKSLQLICKLIHEGKLATKKSIVELTGESLRAGDSPEVMDCLFDTLKIDINTTNERDGNSFLHMAVLSRNQIGVNYLLQHNADVNTINNDGQTPLLLAISKKLNKIALDIAKAPSLDKKMKFKKGQTYYTAACSKNMVAVADLVGK